MTTTIRAQIVINTIQIHKLACSAIGAHYQSDTTVMAYLSNCIFKTLSKRKKKRKAKTELNALYMNGHQSGRVNVLTKK